MGIRGYGKFRRKGMIGGTDEFNFMFSVEPDVTNYNSGKMNRALDKNRLGVCLNSLFLPHGHSFVLEPLSADWKLCLPAQRS
jgi:hypothetical protein